MRKLNEFDSYQGNEIAKESDRQTEEASRLRETSIKELFAHYGIKDEYYTETDGLEELWKAKQREVLQKWEESNKKFQASLEQIKARLNR